MALQSQRLYGLPNGLTVAPTPNLRRKVDPTVVDMALPGTTWTNYIGQTYWVALSQNVSARTTNWQQIVNGAGTGNFINIIVTNDATIGGSIFLPITSAGGADGVIYVGGVRFMSDFGTRNTFLGSGSGNFTVTGINITGIGASSLPAITSAVNVTSVGAFSGLNLTTAEQSTLIGTSAGRSLISGDHNTLVGSSSGLALTVGQNNTALGFSALDSLVDGSGNIAIGSQAGIGFIGTETSNIVIGNNGIPGDNNTIRIGTPGGIHVITHLAGDVDAELNLVASEGVFSQGDPGAGDLGETGFTNVVDETQGVGALTLLSTNGNPGTNTGFMKFYVNNVVVWVPYFDDIAP